MGGGGGGEAVPLRRVPHPREEKRGGGMFFRGRRGTRVPHLGCQNSKNLKKGYLNRTQKPRKGYLKVLTCNENPRKG